ncbi:hypothetical protein BOTBODRAFT_37347 [Botryobasidium botryosum FD-172 SS1]|uniref:glutamine--tRNA ligase n=1 Tax=Botryobasidium botryosum (strain FD-172 SS1) TaxID=930990 RepID=A0A067M313_BOTB1|nr:hypothetical protein BOTBODRAFT_37347 [Botryobasidium botryosum FD-172 SS1]
MVELNLGTAEDAATSPRELGRSSMFEEGFLAHLHKPGENPQTDPRLRDEHLAATGGIVVTRFPPEPNGHLHIGHAKAIAINFGYAKHHGGICYLRYDDTNPETEKTVYNDSILESVRWLGVEPHRVTYASDYFAQLYEFAMELIRRDKAYVCQCDAEDIIIGRGGKRGELGPRTACTHRSRPVEESLHLFRQMQEGTLEQGFATAVLRMKQDLDDPNPQMWDLVAYRFRSKPHPRTGTRWRVYPTYDFAHCLCDTLENITHSLCTSEFITSRQSYEWLCHALDVYTARQYEYGRLLLANTILGKRKMHRVIESGIVTGWDDPRIYSLKALRRRGVPPEAVLEFVQSLGVTTAITSIELARFEEAVRSYLEPRSPRLMVILRPVKVTIENLPCDFIMMVHRPLHPKDPAMGTTSVPLTRTIYIDASDFRTESADGYLRLAPGKTVGLLYVPHPITCISFKTAEDTGEVSHIFCRYEDSGVNPEPEAYIQWVAEHPPSRSPVRVDETRLYNPLFATTEPLGCEDIFEAINENSLEVVRGALLDVGFWDMAQRTFESARENARERISRTNKARARIVAAQRQNGTSASGISGIGELAPPITEEQLIGYECVRFQGLRTAYFALDKDSVGMGMGVRRKEAEVRESGGVNRIVLNQIVPLKQDPAKNDE